MINDNQVETGRELINRRVAEFVQAAFFPADSDAGVRFFIALTGGDQWRQGTAMVPRNARKPYGLAHASSRIAAVFCAWVFFERNRLTSRIFSARLVWADSQAASMISIAARPSSPGEPFAALPRMASTKFRAGDWLG